MSASEPLSSVKSTLISYNSNLSQVWVSAELQFYQQAVDKEKSRITNICNAISSLDSSISQAYEDIRKEEEAAAAAAAAAKAAADKAMADKVPKKK